MLHSKNLKKDHLRLLLITRRSQKKNLILQKKIADEIGIKHIIISYNELENENFVKNDNNRCFYCRDELSVKLIETAKQFQLDVIVDGTHTDDLGDYRPGIDALRKNGIKSPLLDVELSKDEIRTICKKIGLTIYNRPPNSCLASRIPWGQRVTAERLARIEMGETIIKQLTGFQLIRVRDLDGVAKIEVESSNIPILYEKNYLEQIVNKLQMIGFTSVTVDPNGYRSGNLNIVYEK